MTGPTSPNDDPMDEMLIHGARDYNMPGAVPREEIWAKISEARRASATMPTRAVESLSTSLRRPLWMMPGIGIAAALLIATGVVIGRRMNGATTVTNPSTSAQTTVA